MACSSPGPAQELSDGPASIPFSLHGAFTYVMKQGEAQPHLSASPPTSPAFDHTKEEEKTREEEESQTAPFLGQKDDLSFLHYRLRTLQ